MTAKDLREIESQNDIIIVRHAYALQYAARCFADHDANVSRTIIIIYTRLKPSYYIRLRDR